MIEIEPDYDFAQWLDLNCVNCRSNYADNSPQIRTLENRAKAHPNEFEVTQRLSQKCQSCFEKGKPTAKAITDVYSCLYRVGIKSRFSG